MERHVRSVLTGALLDVSGSMERSFGPEQASSAANYARKNQWVRSIFKVADQLVQHDVSDTNLVFLAGVGAESEPAVFDILDSLDAGQKERQAFKTRMADHWRLLIRDLVDRGVTIIESGGAPNVRKWTTVEVISEEVDRRTARVILDALQCDPEFLRKVVNEFLPEECRTRKIGSELAATSPKIAFGAALASAMTGFATGGASWAAQVAGGLFVLGYAADREIRKATKRDIQEVIEKCRCYLRDKFKLTPLTNESVFTASRAHEILHSCDERKDLTDKRITKLLDTIEPYIYGGTPLMQALRSAINIFSREKYNQLFKTVFILSDGEPADDIRKQQELLQALHKLDVTVVSCFITDQHISDHRRLYSHFDSSWDKPAKFMFDMSSTVCTQKIPRTLFIRKGWTVESSNNETRLFFQINHPDLIDEVCDIAKSCVCSQDALSDVLSEVDLDLYINRANEGFQSQKQIELTCYAVASATVMHLSMKRIVGRDGGYPDFFDIRDKIVARFGNERGNTVQVLQQVCPEYRLKCEKLVEERAALKAIIEKRPVVATFRLTKAEWEMFKHFFQQNPTGTLTDADLKGGGVQEASDQFGHAVVLMSFDRHSLRLMNSWGSGWADGGFFRVESAAVLRMKFIDVQWTDLSETERAAFKERGPSVAEKLFSSLKGLQTCTYRCPLCREESLVSEFSGHTLEARCPRCAGSFNANLAGSDLALNLYLTSLLRKEGANPKH